MNYTITDKNQDDAVVDKQDNASVYLDNAKTTIGFLVDIPSVLSKYVFFCLTAEAYDMATFYSIDEIKCQFITAVSENCYKRKAAYIKEIWMNLTTSSRVKEKINNCDSYQELIKNEVWRELPSLQSLNGCFDYFDVSDRDDVDWDLKYIPLGQRLISTLAKDGGNIYLSGDVFLETDNCFQKLGYKTQYINIFSNDSDKYDKLFFRWYCMGEVLDIVLETIFSNRNVQLSKSLYCHLMSECKDNDVLAKLVQTRYDQMALYRPGLKNITFYDKQIVSVNVVGVLNEAVEVEPLPYGVGKIKGYRDKDDYINLFNSLINLKLLRPIGSVEKYGNSLDDFLSIFSDDIIRNRLYWYGKGYELKFFVDRLFHFRADKIKGINDFCNRIKNCFRMMSKDKNGRLIDNEVSASTVRTSNKEIKISIKINAITNEFIPKDSDNDSQSVDNRTIELLKLNYSALVYNKEQIEIMKNKAGKDGWLRQYEINFIESEALPVELFRLEDKQREYEYN